jgi:hypothetical protein
MVPTPVLSEVLIKAGADKARVLSEISNSRYFKVQPFDELAAVELTMLPDTDLQSKRKLSEVVTRAKIKFDRQILAIAKVNDIKTIYSDDRNLCDRAQACGILTVGAHELPLPPVPPQGKLELSIPAEQPTQEKKNAEPKADTRKSDGARSAPPHASDGTETAQAKGGEVKG